MSKSEGPYRKARLFRNSIFIEKIKKCWVKKSRDQREARCGGRGAGVRGAHSSKSARGVFKDGYPRECRSSTDSIIRSGAARNVGCDPLRCPAWCRAFPSGPRDPRRSLLVLIRRAKERGARWRPPRPRAERDGATPRVKEGKQQNPADQAAWAGDTLSGKTGQRTKEGRYAALPARVYLRSKDKFKGASRCGDGDCRPTRCAVCAPDAHF